MSFKRMFSLVAISLVLSLALVGCAVPKVNITFEEESTVVEEAPTVEEVKESTEESSDVSTDEVIEESSDKDTEDEFMDELMNAIESAVGSTGIDSASPSEFTSYDNMKVSGTQVLNAIFMFQGRDVAIVVQTKTFSAIDDTHDTKAINYGAILTSDGCPSTDSNKPEKITSNEGDGKDIITTQAKTAYVVQFAKELTSDGGVSIWMEPGASCYTGYLHNTDGLADSCYDTLGTTEEGNAAFIESSARFSSVLIKDPTGSIIGIFFKQLQ